MRCVHATLIATFVLASRPTSAQERPFVFTLTTPATAAPAPLDADSILTDQAFSLYAGGRPESHAGVQFDATSRVMIVGQVGTPLDRYDFRGTSQQAEALMRIVDGPGHASTVTVGGGVRREFDGTNVWLGRVIVGHAFERSQVYGNVLIEKAGGNGRDAADLVTSIGWSRRVTPQMSLGFEAVGEDLEGFWSRDEADGGARLLVGPSMSVALSPRWRLSTTGGPILHSEAASNPGALSRTLPAGARNGYALRGTVTCAF
jgi:hypothetical protein